MKKRIVVSLLAAAMMLFSFAAVAQVTYTGLAGVSLITSAPATATSVSNAIRLPNYSGTGVLTITESGITGSPSGCSVKLAYEGNNASTVSTANTTTTAFTPATGVQQFTVTPVVGAGDQYVATYACSTTYPTAGTITVSFSPFGLFAQANVGDPCANPAVAKSSAVINVSVAGEASLVAAATGKSIYVCSIVDGSAGTTPSLTLQSGTVAGCASGTTAMTGAIPFASSSMLNMHWGGTLVQVPSGQALCALTVGTGHNGVVTYVAQ